MISTGGGAALIKAASLIDDSIDKDMSDEEKMGFNIITNSLQAPLRQIAKNAGIEDISTIREDIQTIEDATICYDFNKVDIKNLKEARKNMMESGIVDPLKVTRSALENAVSMASVFLTTEAAITDIPEEKKDIGGASAAPGMGMGM